MNNIDMSEHLACRSYDNGAKPLLEHLFLEKEKTYSFTTLQNKIILVLNGSLIYSMGKHLSINAASRHILLLPAGYEVDLTSKDGTAEILCFRLNGSRNLCHHYNMEHLLQGVHNISPIGDTPYHLPFVNQTNVFVESIHIFLKVGVRCQCLHEIKGKELMYHLRMFYTKEVLSNFFHPILSQDMSFSEKIQQVAIQSNTVKELADATGYSVSGFNKKFKKTFDIPPYVWLQNRRAERLFKELISSTTPLKLLSQNYGFSHQVELHKFCMKYFGETPQNVRNMKKKTKKAQKPNV